MEYQTDGRTLGHDSWIAICAYASLQDWEFSGAVICLLPCKDLGNIVVNTLHMCDLQRCFYKTVTGNMCHFLGTPYRYKDHHKIPLGRVLVIVQQENNGRFPNDRSVAWRQIECRGLSRRCLQETLYKPSNMFKKNHFFLSTIVTCSDQLWELKPKSSTVTEPSLIPQYWACQNIRRGKLKCISSLCDSTQYSCLM